MFDIPMELKSLEKEIIAYELEPIQKGKILFYGHSLFTRRGAPTWGYRRMDEDIRVIKLRNQPELFETPEDVGNFRKLRDDIFVADKVHPNQAGYDILGPIFRKALVEVL